MTSEWLAEDKLNGDVPWDAFDPKEYIKRNYLEIQPVDREILVRVRDHFRDHFRDHSAARGDGGPRGAVPEAGAPGSGGRGRGAETVGIDVGAGPNLYPALAMLPWCDRITLLERSARNLDYLRGQLPGYDANWDQFWEVLKSGEDGAGAAYTALDADPRDRLRRAVGEPVSGSLFDLRDRGPAWDLGTMFFVAESITTSLEEFRRGVGCFMNALKPGAPFAAAFMEHSEGYRVGSQEFPARDIDEEEVRNVLDPYAAAGMEVALMDNPQQLVRHGYTGMILACGRRRTT
ncbi:SCO2525 family SAM-dependent methyltransferase [Streptomyces sp. NPDC091281]|uniref:SCO2525 family SAM-dependent methyltransferase n=1 Tax=Streptomyces sp. NPDC091281 TaxID=3365985 RepID=UPI00380D7023